MSSQAETLATTGRLWLRRALTEADLAPLDGLTDNARLTTLPALGPLTRLIHSLQPKAQPTRAVAFNKTPEANWGVPWHQDRIIAVKARHDIPGFTNWSAKHGQWHCEPPLALLQNMLFVRLHLDPCDASTGAMEIALGSHVEGAVAADQADTIATRYPLEPCTASRGDVLILNMLTLHRSRPATIATTRRTLRVDYSADPLPHPMDWAV